MTNTLDKSINNRVAEARKILEQKWDLDGDCGSCGWHAALYEHDVSDADIEWALESNKGVLELSCVSKDDEDCCTHRGVKIDISQEKKP